jgi:hypothetical protein
VRFLKGMVIAALAGSMLAIASTLTFIDSMRELFSKFRPVLQVTRKQPKSTTKAA